MTWITDNNNNRASVERWRSEEAARKSLATLINCYGCSDCSHCYDCYGCSDCYDCSHCSRCSRCSDCYGCSDCSDCSRCSRCSHCSRCSRCSDCYGCSDCSDCSDCSRCSRCSHFAQQKMEHEIPVVADIHKAVYEAASKPKAFDMSSWHTCETTHCRAGWVIHLAEQAGYDLEKATSPVFAAMQIYKASGYQINPSRFFDNNEDAMADMKRLAKGEPNA